VLEWTENLSVGVPVLDQHHRHLFDLLAQIAALAEGGMALDSVRAVFDELNRYIAYHFSEEEAMMERADFPFLELHRHSHQTIAMRVSDMSAALSGDNVERVARELHDFLTGWLVHHIEIEDFEYRPFLTGKE
jgi:hemerythrin